MKLIPEWRRAWRLLTVQVGALAVLWVALPADAQQTVLRLVGLREELVPGVLGLLVIVARLVSQQPNRKD